MPARPARAPHVRTTTGHAGRVAHRVGLSPPCGHPAPPIVAWVRRYLEILRTPHVGRLFAASLLARLPMGINGLAIVLLLRAETGSFGIAGATSGALALGSGAGAPLAGRMIDALGERVLLACAAVHATGLLTI